MANASAAAADAPMEHASRVFTRPGTGGLAKIQTGISVTNKSGRLSPSNQYIPLQSTHAARFHFDYGRHRYARACLRCGSDRALRGEEHYRLSSLWPGYQ